MANKHREQDKWLISTSVVLTVFAAGYFFLLFPREATSILEVYISYIFVTLIVVLATFLTIIIYRKQINNRSSSKFEQDVKFEKTVAQIIWRNRYVLQSKQSQLLYDPSLENREKWNDIKETFAREYVYLTIPESQVSFNKVSELIEKSLQGASIGSIRPPTYSVKSINR